MGQSLIHVKLMQPAANGVSACPSFCLAVNTAYTYPGARASIRNHFWCEMLLSSTIFFFLTNVNFANLAVLGFL